MTRREWMTSIAATGAASAMGAMPASAAAKPVHCTILDYRGEPLSPDAMTRFHICDLLTRPITFDPQFASGTATFDAPTKPFRIAVPLAVPGFGQVFLYADNRGAGYTPRSLSK